MEQWVIIAIVASAAVLLIVVGLGWRSAPDTDAAAAREAAEAIISARYRMEETLADGAGDLPYVEDPIEANIDATLAPQDAWDPTPALPDEARARVDPDAGTIEGDLPETHAPARVGWQDAQDAREAAPSLAGEVERVPHG